LKFQSEMLSLLRLRVPFLPCLLMLFRGALM